MSLEYTLHGPGKDGKMRVKVKGRRGFPIVMLPGETPEQAVARHDAKRAENQAAQATEPPRTGEGDAGSPSPTTSEGAAPWDSLASAIRDRLPPERDRQPDPGPRVPGGGGRNDPPASSRKVAEAKLREMLEEILTVPMIPFGMPVHDPSLDRVEAIGPDQSIVIPGLRPRCAYCRDHFRTEGPKAAAEVMEMAKNSDPIYRMLERMYPVYMAITAGGVLAGYFAKPLMHHVMPAPMVEMAGAAAGPFLAVKDGKGNVLHEHMPPRPPKAPRPPRKRKRGGPPGRMERLRNRRDHAPGPPPAAPIPEGEPTPAAAAEAIRGGGATEFRSGPIG